LNFRDWKTGESATSYAEIRAWLREKKNRRAIPHRLAECDYTPVRNEDAKDGLWKIDGARQVAYAKTEMNTRDRLKAVGEFIKGDAN
jgi:hypothetical protein